MLLLATADESPPQDGSPQVTTEPSSFLKYKASNIIKPYLRRWAFPGQDKFNSILSLSLSFYLYIAILEVHLLQVPQTYDDTHTRIQITICHILYCPYLLLYIVIYLITCMFCLHEATLLPKGQCSKRTVGAANLRAWDCILKHVTDVLIDQPPARDLLCGAYVVDTNWPKNSCGWLSAVAILWYSIFGYIWLFLFHVTPVCAMSCNKTMQNGQAIQDCQTSISKSCCKFMRIPCSHYFILFPLISHFFTVETRRPQGTSTYLHHTLAQVICNTWSIAAPVWVAPGNDGTSSWERRKSTVSGTNLPWLKPWGQGQPLNWDCSLQEVNAYQTNHS